MTRLTPRSIATIGLIIVLGALIAGCNSQQLDKYRAALKQTEQKSKQLEQPVANLASTVHDTREYMESLPEDSGVREKLEPTVSKASNILDQVTAYQMKLDDAAKEIRGAIEDIEAGKEGSIGTAMKVAGESGGAVAGFLPPPWNAVVAGGSTLLALLGGLFGASERKKRKEESGHISKVAKAMDALNQITGALSDQKGKSAMDKAMGTKTKRRLEDAASE